MGFFSKFFGPERTARVPDVPDHRALPPHEVLGDNTNICDQQIRRARRYINDNLRQKPGGTFWIYEDYDKVVVDRIKIEYSEAGWHVVDKGEVLHISRN